MKAFLALLSRLRAKQRAWRTPALSTSILGVVLFAGSVAPVNSAEQSTLQAGTMAARMAACTACHGEQGAPGPDAYYPRIAGKPELYLFNQLVNFRDGYRIYPPMQMLLQNLSDDYLRDMARWFSEQHPAYDAPIVPRVAKAMLERGHVLALKGDSKAGIPACIACHGETLTGQQPGVPGLLGIPRDYIASQFGAWRTHMRNAAKPDCMAEIAARMTPEDVAAVAVWLSAQPVPDGGVPAPASNEPLPMECGSHTLDDRPAGEQ